MRRVLPGLTLCAVVTAFGCSDVAPVTTPADAGDDLGAVLDVGSPDVPSPRDVYADMPPAQDVPPTVDATDALARVKALLEANPPYGAKVRFEAGGANAGWNAPALAPWLEAALEEASATHFGKPPVSMGEGGSIPFMGMLGQRFPEAQFFITGVLGPGSNAHGPNEFLDIPMAKKLTACVADVIARHASR